MDEWGAIPVFFGSDLEYICQEVGMQGYGEANVCSERLADRSDYPFTDNSEGAAWRPTVHNNSDYMAKWKTPLHPLLTSGWWNRFTIRYDILQIMDHHGITSTAHGSIYNAHIVRDDDEDTAVLPGSNQQDRLDFLNSEIHAYSRMHRIQNKLPTLKLSNLLSDGWPDLHGPRVKAANTRSITPYVKALQQRARDANPTAINEHMYKPIDSIDTLYAILYSGGCFLTDAEKSSFAYHCDRIGRHWQMLANLFALEARRNWPQRPKLQYAVGHLAKQARLVNPRFVQAYASESMVGRVATNYKASLDGPNRPIVQRKVAVKYLTGMLLAYTSV